MLSGVQTTQLARVKRHESIAARTYRELRDALLQRIIEPGQRLVEAELALQMGVSRTPVREALARLAADGMVTATPGGMVARDAAGELEDIYGLRQVLEGYAARLAAARIEAAELDRLDDLCRRIKESTDSGTPELTVELNTAFHLLIAATSRSPRLVRMINDYRAYFLTPGALGRYDRAATERTQRQHEAIVRALRARNGNAAESLVHEHFRDAMAMMLGHSSRNRQQ